MIFFGLSFQSQLAHNDQSSLQALLRVVIDRLCQRHKLTLLLAACLCLTTPAEASLLSLPSNDIISNTSVVKRSIATADSEQDSRNNNSSSSTNNSSDRTQIVDRVANVNSLPSATVLQPELTEPSLYSILDAEFAADRGNTRRALAIYKQQSFKEDATAVFERGLSLSLRSENIGSSLQFAKTWQDQNPDHVPAWFYVAHLALRAHDYTLASETLNRILRYDPRADLSEILIGIYPNTDNDKRELLAALQPLDSEQNASLSVLKAGLLYQFNEPQLALIHINRALARQPDYVPFITLKSDILRKIEPDATVINYVNQSRLRNPDSKSLYLYEIRYLLDLKQSQKAWQLLLDAHNRFTDDAEITLLAALVSLDVEEYHSADQLLNMLAKNSAYLDQAYYYLGISAERQQRFEQAKYYLNGVMQEDLVLAARKKVVAFELLNNNVDAAIATLQKLRQQFEVFAPETYVLEADILWQQEETDEALQLLTRASRKYPDDEALLFARAQLLDDRNDYVIKRTLLNHLQALAPSNLSYQLSYAQLLLSNDGSSEQGLALATAIIQIRYDDPRYDNDLHLQALNVLASNALANDNYAQVINYLQTPYDVFPSLRSGVLLLRAYQGLGNNDKVDALLADLQQRFSFGQHNINDHTQLY
ncbi:tetratricopeptide repeat protein [Psychrobacter sp. LV10R520-6]|uniref:tetratricopeptide repeat protein n=1 Tax=Psychrobacter sp. LV10R520-6 TaxID=1415574 RepID=UPI0024C9399F|nr:tetratricopeptide repeat protein [Psychrobacter sp. LV10R520-6]SNT71309.1 Tetratricopeptide repeat-containing protein [Psychrobacter sp. LV10R520-6]